LTVTYSPTCTLPASTTVMVSPKTSVSAGPDQIICESPGTVTLTGTDSFGPATYLWTSPTSGTFSAPTQLITTYTVSSADKTNGMVILTLTGSSDPCPGSSDSMTLTLVKRPVLSITWAVN
jgi:hypothetical protein